MLLSTQAHPDTNLTLDELGKKPTPYRSTFEFSGSYLNPFHQSLDSQRSQIKLKTLGLIKRNIAGWLNPRDALKLYEIAYFANGDVLEMGCYHGLSTTIQAHAIRASGRPRHLYTFDLMPKHARITAQTVWLSGLSGYVTARAANALQAADQLIAQDLQFGMLFIDHAHDYQNVFDLCQKLDSLTEAQGFVLFHDYNDPRNRDETHADYGVYQAVRDGLPSERFGFYGTYGCIGMFRKV